MITVSARPNGCGQRASNDGGKSAAQGAIWLARGGAVVTLLQRRADLHETMSDYVIHDIDLYGVVVRDRSEIGEGHGADGRLEAVTLRDGERMALSFPFLFLGALPCTHWLAVGDGAMVVRFVHERTSGVPA